MLFMVPACLLCPRCKKESRHMCEKESWYSLTDCTITVDAVQVSLGVPYNDDFSVEVRWNVENNHQHQQHRRQQHFQKSPCWAKVREPAGNGIKAAVW